MSRERNEPVRGGVSVYNRLDKVVVSLAGCDLPVSAFEARAIAERLRDAADTAERTAVAERAAG